MARRDTPVRVDSKSARPELKGFLGSGSGKPCSLGFDEWATPPRSGMLSHGLPSAFSPLSKAG